MNIVTLLTRAVERFPHRLALTYGQRRWTYAEWMARIRRFARALSNLGVRPSDRVAFYLTASEASVTTYFACQLLGAVAVPVNFRLAQGEVAYILEDSGACVLVYDESAGEAAGGIAHTVRTVRDLISCASEADAISRGHHHFEALAKHTDDDAELTGPSPTPDSPSALIYTSGTTGRPKGVMHSHGNDVAIAMNCVMEYSLSRRDMALHIAPLYHVGGLQAYFTPHVMVGGANHVLGRYNPLDTLRAIEAERVTTLFAVPTQLEEMLFHPRFSEFDLSSLRMITTGGAAIAAVTMERVIRQMCSKVFNGYGMTEASLALLLHPEEALSHLGSCGKPTLMTDCRLVAHDASPSTWSDGRREAEVGELVVRGPQTMSGYWNNAAETAQKIKDGWLYTGDVFSKDRDGFYTFRGRLDDLIVSGGENIYPREVEEALHRCPGVKHAAVVGMPDARWGSRVVAFIVRASPSLTEEAVDAFCRSSGELAAFKRPKQVVFVEHLPTSPGGKVIKRQLMELARDPDS